MKYAFFARLIAIAALAIAAPAFADQALATAKNCMTCHAIDKKLVGPAYKDVAAKYAGQKDAVDKLAVKIMKGGSGVYGPVPMPANTQVNEAEAKKLAAWVLSPETAASSEGIIGSSSSIGLMRFKGKDVVIAQVGAMLSIRAISAPL